MSQLLKKLKIQSVAISIVYVIFGICLLAIPDTTKLAVCYATGAALILSGVVMTVNFFLYSDLRFGFLWGLIDLFAGIFIVSSANILAAPEIFGLVFGLVLVIKSVFEAQTAFDARRCGIKFWWLEAVYALLLLTLGVVLLFDPFGAERALFIYLAVCALLNGLAGLAVNILAGRPKRANRTPHRELSDGEFEIADAPED